MTCNPQWPEIQDNLLPHQQASDGADIMTRAFMQQHDELQHDLTRKKCFRKISSIEW